ncbi:MAG: CAP domain-containing protein [Chloroflexota bacterium]|nr:CAP domain-containing protein [Chloroflexota bacterium]
MTVLELALVNPKVRKPSRSTLVLAFLFLLLFFTFPLMSSLAEEPAASAPLDPVAQTRHTLLSRINEIRASYGLHPYGMNERLVQAAQGHVADMRARGYMSHWGSDGSGYYDRVYRTGYVAGKVNEAIGWGYNMERMLNWWLNSRVHRQILLSPLYTEIGIGYLGNPERRGGHWWTVNVATHR